MAAKSKARAVTKATMRGLREKRLCMKCLLWGWGICFTGQYNIFYVLMVVLIEKFDGQVLGVVGKVIVIG
jgi:hypothetical protein